MVDSARQNDRPVQKRGAAASDVDRVFANAVTLLGRNRPAEAEQLFRAVLDAQSDHFLSIYYLGVIQARQGKFEEAAQLLRRALTRNPNYAEAHTNYGLVLMRLGRLKQAMSHHQRALKLNPRLAQAHNNLGILLVGENRIDEGIAHYNQALAISPTYIEARSNLAVALAMQDRLEEAINQFEEIIRQNPSIVEGRLNYAATLLGQGRILGAIAQYERALDRKPDFALARSNLLLALNYLPEITREAVFAAHARWDDFHAPASTPPGHALPFNPDSERRLRIGYVSPDFRQHAVANFIAPLLAAHDRRVVEVFCYANVAHPDAMTAKLKAQSDHWDSIFEDSDDAAAARIRNDKIDILVDLAGHTGNNRLGLFTLKPAPVEITWLGYPNTTGIKAIGYRITDATADPDDGSDRFFSEQLIRLPRCFLCYEPPTEAGEVGPLPLTQNGYVTFGSFNAFPKINQDVIALWSRLLQALPSARLFLKSKPLADKSTCERLFADFEAAGVTRDRILLAPWTKSLSSHWENYHLVDVALDPFPYNGTTTTCEALWMGVPVISLRGDRHSGRVGASLLQAAGLSEFVAEDPDRYIAIAVNLASDADRLARYRTALRQQVRASSLCDGRGFAQAMEAAYRAAWRTCCMNEVRVAPAP